MTLLHFLDISIPKIIHFVEVRFFCKHGDKMELSKHSVPRSVFYFFVY